jgi:hypothetical protein
MTRTLFPVLLILIVCLHAWTAFRATEEEEK